MKRDLFIALTGILCVFIFPLETLAAAYHFEIDTAGTLTTDLVAYYPMEGNSTDVWGSNNGTDSSISYGTSYGKVNKGADFNGSASISLPALIPIGTSVMSVAYWMYFPSTPTTIQQFIASNNDGMSGYWGMNGGASPYNTPSFLIRNSVGTVYNCIGASVSTGAWHFIVGVYDGSTLYVYIDGVLSNSISASGTIGGQQVYLGKQSSGLYPFTGYLDEIGVWSKVLSSQEISDLYNGGSGQTMILPSTAPVSAPPYQPSSPLQSPVFPLALGFIGGCAAYWINRKVVE